MANKTKQSPDEQRPTLGQSVPLGDRGDGNTGVAPDEQGISNRPGDRARELDAEQDDDGEDLEGDEDDDVEDVDEDLEGDEDDDVEDAEDAEDDQEDDDRDGVTDPGSEPGKPV